MFKLKKMGVYLTGAVLGLLVGALLYYAQPIKWKGQALVKIGQIAESQYTKKYIEPLETVEERLKSSFFIQTVAEKANKREIVALLSADKDAGLSIKPIRNGDSLKITVDGRSAELVRASIDSMVAVLVSSHEAILNVYKADIIKELAKLENESDALSKRLTTVLGSEAGNSKLMVEERLSTGFIIMSIQHELDVKLDRSSLLRESINSSHITPTSLLGFATVSERRIFSSLWRACLFGTLSGIFLSIIWIQWGQRVIHSFS